MTVSHRDRTLLRRWTEGVAERLWNEGGAHMVPAVVWLRGIATDIDIGETSTLDAIDDLVRQLG